LEVSCLEELLESFATAGLGLELKGRMKDLSALPPQSSCCGDSDAHLCARVAWHTERGIATLRAVYDEAQSLKVRAQVVKIAWWIGTEHHEGWWHRYPKFPRDWIKGIGRWP
jgi:hypothetical protein